ncbi:MAG TPA: DsbA family protein [Terriglobia bacterium]|nr:DsbA family protein [Terriglobia bacterium]
MKSFKGAWTALAVTILVGGLTIFTPQKYAASSESKSEAPSREKVERYVRERFGLVSTTKVTIASFEPSADPGFLQTMVTVNDGKQSKDVPVSVSKDGRYLLVGPWVPLDGDVDAAIVQQVREHFKIPAKVNLATGALGPSPYHDFLVTTLTATDGSQTQTQKFIVTGDKKFLGLGDLYPFNVDPRRQALGIMSLKDQPTQGPASAPVTIVEYADLECPSCAHMHQYLEDEFLPKYGNKVRMVFKEFPLPFHAWSKNAAVANECAFQMDPAKFVPYRTLIFKHQTDIDASQASSTDVRDLLLGYGQQAGLDRGRLSACFDAQASLARVEAGRKEGEQLSVTQTPTFYVNGRIYPGPTPEILTQAVEDALNAAKEPPTRASR